MWIIWSWDLIHWEDSSTYIIINTSYKILYIYAFPSRRLIPLPAKAKCAICNKPFNPIQENFAKWGELVFSFTLLL